MSENTKEGEVAIGSLVSPIILNRTCCSVSPPGTVSDGPESKFSFAAQGFATWVFGSAPAHSRYSANILCMN